MSNVHMIVGTVVIVAYAITLVLNVRLALTGTETPGRLPISFAAATLLALQYMLGFSVLGSGRSVPAMHFLLALSAVIPVGIEHGLGARQENPRRRGMLGALVNVLTLVLVVIAYIIGQNNA